MKIFGVFAGLLMVMISAKVVAQKNLVTNGGFEDSDLYGWNSNGGATTPWDKKAGKNSCVIITVNTEKWVGIDQIIKIPKKIQELEFSAWLKITNVIKGKNDWDGAVFTVVFLDSQDKEVGEGVNIARLTGDNDWALFKKQIKMPEKAYSFKVLIAMGNASGSLLIDDVAAKTVSQ